MHEEVVGQRLTTAEELQSDIQYKCCDPASSAGQASGTMPLVHLPVTKKIK
jgi:hypothetical protein